MSNQNAPKIIVIVLAVIGTIAIIVLLGMWLMHVTMMGSGMIEAQGRRVSAAA